MLYVLTIGESTKVKHQVTKKFFDYAMELRRCLHHLSSSHGGRKLHLLLPIHSNNFTKLTILQNYKHHLRLCINLLPRQSWMIVVWDRNSVSVTVSAKSIGIGIRAEFFFSKTETFFLSNFTHFFLLLGGIQVFISLKINLTLQKKLKVSNVWKKIWF